MNNDSTNHAQSSNKMKPILYVLLMYSLIVTSIVICLGIKMWNISVCGTSFLTPLNLKVDEVSQIENKKIAFSVDDTITIFKDLTNNDYHSIFENPTLRYFKQLHDEYGLKVTFYVFYEFDNFSLDKATDKFRSEFIGNSDWLKFGFHAYQGDSDYSKVTKELAIQEYNNIIQQLKRICGEETIDRVVRFQSYKGNFENLMAFKDLELGITGIYTADDDRNSYYLTKDVIQQIQEKDYVYQDDLLFVHTDFRLENISDFKTVLSQIGKNQDQILTVFTHEWKLNDKDILLKLKQFCDLSVANDYEFSFLEG